MKKAPTQEISLSDSGDIQKIDATKLIVDEQPHTTFRQAILRVLAESMSGVGLTIWDIESRVSELAVRSEYGLIELDALSLLHEGLLEATPDPRLYRLSELGAQFVGLWEVK